MYQIIHAGHCQHCEKIDVITSWLWLLLHKFQNMFFDIVFIIAFIWAFIKGYNKGLILQAATLAALILGIYGSIKFSSFTAKLITEKTEYTGEYLSLIAYALTFIGIVVAIHFLARMAEKLLEAISLNFLNRILGALFNIIKYAFIISALLVVINTVDRKVHFLPQDKIDSSILYKPLSALVPLVFPHLPFDISEPINIPPSYREEKFV
ncbi:MAG: CvpA family protein [Bacteroidales bacterium]|nr:CvpA family protein [Bacteroidales bacterium]